MSFSRSAGAALLWRASRVAPLVVGLMSSGCDGCGSAPLQAHPAEPEPVANAPRKLVRPVPASAAPIGAQPEAHAASAAREFTWVYPETAVGPMQVVVSVPAWKPGDPPLPVLITMHGRGEALKGPEKGARGWLDDYELNAAIRRLHAPPITKDDFKGFAGPARLKLLNESLEKHPYRGLIVVMPYTPDILRGERAFSACDPLAKFLVDELLVRVRRETPARQDAAGTGIDGVSLGGRASLLVGLARPKSFGVVATLQPAFDSEDTDELSRRAKLARQTNPKLKFRLLTSNQDFYLESTRAISHGFDDAGIEHEFLIVAGNHSYEFNRGPGAYEMLLFHDRVLRGEASL